MVRRSQTSNPRSVVVLTSGTGWGTRAAGQRRASGAEMPMPKRQGAKMRVLRRSLEEARKAIKTKRWPQARFALGQAGALANALPADQAKQEREQLALLLKRYKGRNTPAAAEARKSTKSTSKPTPAAPKGGKKAATLKSKEPKPSPVRELGERRFDRAAFGYGPADDTTSPDKR